MGYGEWIRRQRKRLNLTQRELGKRVGATDSYISHLENEFRIPSRDLALALVRAFDLGAEDRNAFLEAVESTRARRAEERSLSRGRNAAAGPGPMGYEPRVLLIGLPDADELGSLSTDFEPSCVAVASDAGLVALGGDDGTVRLWRTGSGEPPEALGRHAGMVNALAFTRDCSTLASAGEDGALTLWDPETGDARCTVDGDTPATALAASADSERLASGYADGTARIWDLANGERLQRLDTHAGRVRALAFSPDGHVLACGGDGAGLWDLETGELRRALRGLGRQVHALGFSDDGALVVAIGDEKWKIWDRNETAEPQGFAVPRPGLVTAAFVSSASLLATVSCDGGLVIREIGGSVTEARVPLDVQNVLAASAAPDGTALAVVGTATATAWAGPLDPEAVAGRLKEDPELAQAYRNLLSAYADPEYREAVLTTLRSLARAAQAD